MWFQNGIQHALNKSREERLLVMIFVHGQDESSNQMLSLYEQDEQVRTLLEKNTVALRLAEGSEPAKMFSAIYPVVVVPSTYLISHDGTPLEILGGAVDKQNLLDKIEASIKLHLEQVNQSKELQVESSQPEDDQVTVAAAASTLPPGVQCVGGVCTLSPRSTDDQKTESANTESTGTEASSSSSSITANVPESAAERIERTKALLEELRKKKAKEEEESKRRQERERIEMGKEMQKAKKNREDAEVDRLVKEREREAMEAKVAKERVLAQIKADQEERKARDLLEQQLAAQAAVNAETASACQRRVKPKQGESNIQFRLPDGNALNRVFKVEQTLLDASAYVSQNSDIGSFSLIQAYPKRKFEQDDYSKSLVDLNLVPSAVLLVIQEASGGVGSLTNVVGGSFLGQLLNFVWMPILLLFSLLRGLFNMAIGNGGSGQESETNSALSPDQSSSPSSSSKTDPKASSSRSSLLNRDGNMMRLRNLNQDDDDENNTWNGNSTQQM